MDRLPRHTSGLPDRRDRTLSVPRRLDRGDVVKLGVTGGQACLPHTVEGLGLDTQNLAHFFSLP
jgi:hypothetical protein